MVQYALMHKDHHYTLSRVHRLPKQCELHEHPIMRGGMQDMWTWEETPDTNIDDIRAEEDIPSWALTRTMQDASMEIQQNPTPIPPTRLSNPEEPTKRMQECMQVEVSFNRVPAVSYTNVEIVTSESTVKELRRTLASMLTLPPESLGVYKRESTRSPCLIRETSCQEPMRWL